MYIEMKWIAALMVMSLFSAFRNYRKIKQGLSEDYWWIFIARLYLISGFINFVAYFVRIR